MKIHLEIVEDASRRLSELANSQVVYITAELQPFSNQQKPDLVYFKEGSGVLYFVEYLQGEFKMDSNYFVKSLHEHISFAKESFDGWDLRYILASERVLSDNDKAIIKTCGIDVTDGIDESSKLADFVLSVS